MTAISNRQPPVDITYDCRGKRKRKHFENAHAGKAFYGLKLKAGKNPKVCKPKETDFCFCSVCDILFARDVMYELPPAGPFCPGCASRNSVPGRVY